MVAARDLPEQPSPFAVAKESLDRVSADKTVGPIPVVLGEGEAGGVPERPDFLLETRACLADVVRSGEENGQILSDADSTLEPQRNAFVAKQPCHSRHVQEVV